MTLEADLKALATDAGMWDGISATLGTAKGAVPALALGTPELSWAAEVTGLTTTYSDFLVLVETRIGQGETETATLGEGLLRVKAAYEDTDTSARGEFDGLWEPVSG